MEELNAQKHLHKAGETVTLRISRSGERMDVQITLLKDNGAFLRLLY